MIFDYLLYIIFFDSLPIFKLGICSIKSTRINNLEKEYRMPIDSSRSRIIPVINYEEAFSLEKALKEIFRKSRIEHEEYRSGYTEFFDEKCLLSMMNDINHFKQTKRYFIDTPIRFCDFIKIPKQNSFNLMIQDGNYKIVSIPNTIIMARYRLSPGAHKLLFLYIMKSPKVDCRASITAREVIEICGLKSRGSYGTIQQWVNEINTSKIYYLLNDRYIQAKWVSFGKYDTGIIKFQLSEQLSNLQLADSTRINLDDIIRLKSLYSIRLYQILKLHVEHQEYNISVSELRNLLCILPGKYPFYANFKSRCLQVAIDDINNLKGVQFSFSEYKKGHAVHSIGFSTSTPQTIANCGTYPRR